MRQQNHDDESSKRPETPVPSSRSAGTQTTLSTPAAPLRNADDAEEVLSIQNTPSSQRQQQDQSVDRTDEAVSASILEVVSQNQDTPNAHYSPSATNDQQLLSDPTSVPESSISESSSGDNDISASQELISHDDDGQLDPLEEPPLISSVPAPDTTVNTEALQQPSQDDNDVFEAWAERDVAIEMLDAHAARVNALLQVQLKEILRHPDTVYLNFYSDARMPGVRIAASRSVLRKNSKKFRHMLEKHNSLTFESDFQFPTAMFLSWTLNGELPTISDGDELKKALHNHGRRGRGWKPIKHYDDIPLPFEGAELVSLWCFGHLFGAADFQNHVMRKIIRRVDRSADFDNILHTLQGWRKDSKRWTAAHQAFCGIFERILAHKAWFLLIQGRRDDRTTIRDIIGAELFEQVGEILNTNPEDGVNGTDARERSLCLVDCVEEFMVPGTEEWP